MFEMLAGRSPFDIVGHADNPDQNTEDYLFQGKILYSVLAELFRLTSFLRATGTCEKIGSIIYMDSS